MFSLTSAGSRVGLYVPKFSRYAPSRFDSFSLTTTRYVGLFFAPMRINRIANNFLILRKQFSVLSFQFPVFGRQKNLKTENRKLKTIFASCALPSCRASC